MDDLAKVCREWLIKNKVRAPESIYQMDSVQEALPELAEAVANVLGYYDDEAGDLKVE